MLKDEDIPTALRSRAAEIRKDPSRNPTRKEDAKLLERAAKLIEEHLSRQGS
jgi:hypothetical protein